MILYEEALIKAHRIRNEIDMCTEYENGFVFCSDKEIDQDGGYYSPIVIWKEDGKAINMPQFVINGTGKEIKTIKITADD